MPAVPEVIGGAGAAETKPLAAPRRGRHPVGAFIARRVGAGLLTLLGVSILIFIATNVLPGNASEVVLGHNATDARIAELDAKLDLDHPAPVLYLNWLGGVVQGDFGDSAVAAAEGREDASISGTLGTPLRNSLVLAALTAILLIPLTLILGFAAGISAGRGRKLDYAISSPSLVFGGLPEFVTGTVLIYIFFSQLDILPPVTLIPPGGSPFDTPDALILPVLTLLAVALGSGIRQVRAGMIEVMNRDYVEFARLNGVGERRVLSRYALRNALAPSVQVIAQNLQYLVGGIIIVESVFAYPGIGTYLVKAVTARDVNEVQAAAILLAALYIAINIIADLIVVFLVPKLRTGLG